MLEKQRALFGYYANSGVREIIPIYPLYAIMMGEHGVSPIELATLFSIWAAVPILTEVPSGALADRFSRKWLIVASGLIKSLAFLTWYLEQNFTGYAIGFALWGAGSSLRSGAWEALLHDLLKQWEALPEFTRVYGRCGALSTLGVGAGELLGGALIIMGYDFVLLVSMMIPLAATFVFAVCVKDPPVDETVFEPDYFVTLKAGLKEAATNRAVLYILLTYSSLIILYGVFEEFVSPLLYEKGFSLMLVGILGAFISAMEAVGMALADRVRHISLMQLLGLMGAASVVLALIYPIGGFWVPLLAGLYFLVFGMASTLFGAELQDAIEGPARATVTSVAGFGENIGAILGFMAFGAVAEVFGMNGATLATGVAGLLLALCFMVLARGWQIQHRRP